MKTMRGPYPENDPLLSVCPFKTPPCVCLKRPRVTAPRAHVERGRIECSHADVLNLHTEKTHTENTHRKQTHRKMSPAQSHFFQMSVAGRPARPVRHGRTMWPENAFGVSDGVIHSRIFILRVEPSSERQDILLIPQYQLNLRHLSSTAARSTQNLDLLGFPPHPGFRECVGVTHHKKSELSAHHIPGAG